LLGILSKRITPKAGLTGLLTGFVLGMTRLGFKVFGTGMGQDNIFYSVFFKMNGYNYEVILFFIVIALMIIVSYFTPRADPVAINGLYVGSATAEQKAVTRASWNNWDLLFSGIIICIIIAFYAYFW
jgi:SSS family solute:Na+ symporter